MCNKKAVICTIMFFIIIVGVIIGSCFIRLNEQTTLFDFLAALLAGLKCTEFLFKFYDWLKTEDKKVKTSKVNF